MLTFLCELGPPPYAITGPDGAELSDRWQDALVMKDMVRALWQRIVDEDARGDTKAGKVGFYRSIPSTGERARRAPMVA